MASTDPPLPLHVPLAAALAAAPEPGRASALLLSHGTMQLRLYAPRGEDRQTPHAQDELYIIAAGSADFVRGPERVAAGRGDALFVAAGVAHRFEAMSEDFAAWVVFWGPAGGERAA